MQKKIKVYGRITSKRNNKILINNEHEKKGNIKNFEFNYTIF